MVWINVMGNFCNTTSSVLDRWSKFLCCEHINLGECMESVLVQIQLGLNASIIFFIYILALIFFEHDGRSETKSLYRFAWLGFLLQLILMSIIVGSAAAFLVLSGPDADATDIYGQYFLGTFAALHPILTWTPQIWTTYKRKSSGSLSLIMLLLVFPGALLVAFYQGILNEEYVVAIPALISGIELGVLLAMVLYYDCVNWRAKKAKEKEEKNGKGRDEEESFIRTSTNDSPVSTEDDTSSDDERRRTKTPKAMVINYHS